MAKSFVRLEEILIRNFKNVREGHLSFENRRKKYKASILGLYGQNGSGKTALIDAMSLLKYVLCGRSIPAEMADHINVDAKFAELQYVFSVVTSKGEYKATYEFKLSRERNTLDQNQDLSDQEEVKYMAVIYDEILSYSFTDGESKIKKSPVMDTNTQNVFIPQSKYNCIIGKNKDTSLELLIAKKMALKTSRSFIFSRELIDVIKEQWPVKKTDKEFARHVTLLYQLVKYGNWELFVINTTDSSMISLNALPLAFRIEEQDLSQGASGMMMLPLEKSAIISKEDLIIARKVIKNMNVVLQQLVPGLTIGIKELESQIIKNGKIAVRVQLMSYKNAKEIPLKYESDGIKKIISVLHLFIVIYNQPSITVAIDELDAGIFEYLLGELIRIISEKGKGQLIFTSHNLRPLETLDRGFVAFTTTNPDKRYVRMLNIKDNNNLRDFYYRDIVLGEQREELYESTNNAEIAFAFREAGEDCGS